MEDSETKSGNLVNCVKVAASSHGLVTRKQLALGAQRPYCVTSHTDGRVRDVARVEVLKARLRSYTVPHVHAGSTSSVRMNLIIGSDSCIVYKSNLQ